MSNRAVDPQPFQRSILGGVYRLSFANFHRVAVTPAMAMPAAAAIGRSTSAEPETHRLGPSSTSRANRCAACRASPRRSASARGE